MIKYAFKFILTLFVSAFFLYLTGCGGGSSIGGTSDSVSSYSGPGSKWDVSLDSTANTFTITHRPDATSAIDMTVNGTFTTLASGFLKLTVTNSAGTLVPLPSAGDEAHAVEIPGYAFILKPLNPADDQLITMVVSGTCPTTDQSINWITANVANAHSASVAGNDFFGTFTWSTATNTAALPTTYDLAGFTSLGAGSNFPNITCADGIAQPAGDVTMYLTDTGGAMVHANGGTPADESDDQFILGFAEETLADLQAYDGDYIGVLFNDNSVAGSKIEAIAATCNNSVCAASNINPDTGVLGGTVTVDLSGGLNVPSNGFATGTITIAGNVGNISCMVDTAANGTTKNIISCSGQSPDDTSKLFNIILVTK